MSTKLVRFLVLFAQLSLCFASPFDDDDSYMHTRHKNYPYDDDTPIFDLEHEMEASFWSDKGKLKLKEHLDNLMNNNRAKNVIFFLGDGMSIATIVAARTYMGQLENKTGEESELSFEKFPVTGLSRTYCVDSTVADSACSATAYLCGVKGNDGTIGVNARVKQNDCRAMNNASNHVYSLADKFMKNKRDAGLLTTTRVTHASPAGVYAHTAHRDWENNEELRKICGVNSPNKDIAYQLINNDVGKKLKVILGGGRREFLPENIKDESGVPGMRTDGINLIERWKTMKNETKHEYVANREGLLGMKEDTEYLLGLFESSHLKYHLQANKETQPTFEDMVEAAIKILSKNKEGYFLFAEGGRIDHAHHDTMARLALDETVEFSKGIAKAVNMTSRDDTLIIVTSDHAHAMTINGYPIRGRNILKDVGYAADDNIPYTTLSYANGPGYRKNDGNDRYDPTTDPDFISDKVDYKYPAMVPLDSETHGGDDVGVFALGPQQQIFTGSYEQSTIPYLIEYAACLNNDCNHAITNAKLSFTLFVAVIFMTLKQFL